MNIIRTVGAFALIAIGASCGMTTDGNGDAAPDAFVSKACNTNEDCPTGATCLFPVNAGCGATKQCFPPANPGACKALFVCSCTGDQLQSCNGGASEPIGRSGPCEHEAKCGDCTSALACEVCDVCGYAPPTLGKPIVVVNACTQAELQSFVTACFSSTSTTTTCAAWGAVDSGACGACLVPALQSDTAWGPFDCASAQSACDPNSGGCVDAVLGAVAQEKSEGGAGSCGDLTTQANGCLDYACGTCTTTDVSTCEAAATIYECKTYVDAESSATGACASIVGDAASNASVCFPKTDADHVAFLNVFCGTGP